MNCDFELFLEQERKKIGLNRKEVAKKLNIPYPAYQKLESGTITVNLENVKKIAKFYKVDDDFLFSIAYPKFKGKLNNIKIARDIQKKYEISFYALKNELVFLDECYKVLINSTLYYDEKEVLEIFKEIGKPLKQKKEVKK